MYIFTVLCFHCFYASKSLAKRNYFILLIHKENLFLNYNRLKQQMYSEKFIKSIVYLKILSKQLF